MKLRRLKILLFALACLGGVSGQAQDTFEQRHVEVAMRMIGHELLLATGDSSSKVLPIRREGGRYRIPFESEFAFQPGELVRIVNEVMEEAGIANSYIVEVEECATQEVVYSYEMNPFQQRDLVPCRSRTQPEGCYDIFLSLKGEGDAPASGTQPLLIAAILIGISGGVFLILRRRGQASADPKLLPLGQFQWDPRSGALHHEGQRLDLSGKEAALLELLHHHANEVVEREVILNKVWGDQGDYEGRTLDVFISKLRKKLEADPRVKILNIRGVGYKLVVG